MAANGSSLSSNNKNNDEIDPTNKWTVKIADAIQNAITYSPLNEGKKALVKMLAGDYDSQAAKDLLDSKKVRYMAVEVDEVLDGNAIRAEMAEIFGRTSVPAIWIGGEFVGGCNDGPMGGIMKLEESGELDVLLKTVGLM